MSNEPIEEEFEEILENIEMRVIASYSSHPTMTDYLVGDIYDALIAYYNAKVSEKTLPPVRLKDVALECYEEIKAYCDLCTDADPEVRKGRINPMYRIISVQDLLRCLKRLRRSVKLWTEKGGRQGYLKFVSNFI